MYATKCNKLVNYTKEVTHISYNAHHLGGLSVAVIDDYLIPVSIIIAKSTGICFNNLALLISYALVATANVLGVLSSS